MVNYKDLGLVNTKEMFAKAIKGGYAIPAFRGRRTGPPGPFPPPDTPPGPDT